jgi:hypothetical protein
MAERILQLVRKRPRLIRRVVMWKPLEAEACLLQLKDGRSVGL